MTMIAIHTDKKLLKLDLSILLQGSTSVVGFFVGYGISKQIVLFFVGYGVSIVMKKSVCFLGGENLRRSVNSFGEKITRCSYHP